MNFFFSKVTILDDYKQQCEVKMNPLGFLTNIFGSAIGGAVALPSSIASIGSNAERNSLVEGVSEGLKTKTAVETVTDMIIGQDNNRVNRIVSTNNSFMSKMANWSIN